jgi:hypothetical protein
MQMAFATLRMIVLVNMTFVDFAMVLVPSMNVAATLFLMATVIVLGASLMSLVFVVETVLKTKMLTVFVMTLTIVLAPLTHADFVTALVKFTLVDVMGYLKVIVTAREMSLTP